MDTVLADTLKANLKSAHTPEARNDAFVLALIALVDCQAKTSARVKRMLWVLYASGSAIILSALGAPEAAARIIRSILGGS